MKKIDFTKINGAGNDFILIDKNKNEKLRLTKDLIKKLCNRRKGIGADGILLVYPSETNDFTLEYYNSDGSLGSLCGNGARCSIKYAFDNFNLKGVSTTFLCNDEIFSGKIGKNDEITFNLCNPKKIELNIPILIDNKKIVGHFANTGSPHIVIFWNEIKINSEMEFHKFDVVKIGRKIRYAKEFQPDGTNVNFIYKENDKLFIRTYERGVEDETLACGTGTVASALIISKVKNVNSPAVFNTRGNDQLTVNFTKKNGNFSKISLTGPVKINYIGTYNF